VCMRERKREIERERRAGNIIFFLKLVTST